MFYHFNQTVSCDFSFPCLCSLSRTLFKKRKCILYRVILVVKGVKQKALIATKR